MVERTHRFVMVAAGLFAFHEIEELVTGFIHIDPWTINVAQWFNLEPTPVFAIVQLLGVASLGWLLIKRPVSHWPYWLLGLIVLLELEHVIHAFALHAYYPGLATAIAILIFAIPYWTQLLRRKQELT